MASSIFLSPALGITSSGGSITTLFADGTAGAPSISFTSHPTVGFYLSSPTVISSTGSFTSTGSITAATFFQSNVTGATLNLSINDGWALLRNFANTIGSTLKFDALPTIASGFGAGAAVTAGSTPLGGSIAVGTTPGTTGTLNFNGTAFPAAVFPLAMNQTTGLAVKATASGTQLVISTATGNFADNDVISWICLASK